MKPDKLDRTAFKHQTVEEAGHNLEYWKKQSYAKRLEAANYLNSVAISILIIPQGWIKHILKSG